MSGMHRGDRPTDESTHEGSDETAYSEAAAEPAFAEGTDETPVSGATSTGDGTETVLHQENLAVGTEVQEVGSVRLRKHVESHPVEYSVPRDVEHVDTNERVAAEEGDSGEVEVLEDGSVSVPVFEEVLVVTKRLVVRERVIVRKRTVVDEYQLQTELRREHLTVDADENVELVDESRPADSDVTQSMDPLPSTGDDRSDRV